jgi:signal transduction histidine kinase
MSTLEANFQADVDAINSIPIVPTLLEVVCRTTGMGFAAIARVTEERWITCSVRDEILFGAVPGTELKVETTICHEIRQSGEPVIIDDVANDPLYCNHHTPSIYGIQSYISMPIFRQDGTFFGTLCAIDPNPHRLNTPEVIGMFRLFADLISSHLSSIERLETVQSKLKEERHTAELREQFIAILGHDLRNPIGAILNSAQLLLRTAPDDRTVRIANIIQDASYRVKALIENMLDFARGRMGEGIILSISPDEDLEKILTQVVTELGLIWPESNIEIHFDLNQPVSCDGKRIAQLFGNLLSNALTHGKRGTPVLVQARCENGEFRLSVTNIGEKISDKAMSKLFHPFSRGEVKPNQDGLGLGLYIASEIAAAHGGKIDVVSTPEQTRFTFRMPLD